MESGILYEYQKVGKSTRLIKGDIVVIFSHYLKRNRWRIGKVVKLIYGCYSKSSNCTN